jgi:hypothetical protein
MQLNLNEHDARLLRELLADYLPELRMEVARTERREYRHRLVDRLDLLERLLEELDRTDRLARSSERS